MSGLSDAQRMAAEHGEGPLLMLAGPGSGKTRVITHRIANLLLQGVPPHQILALTFTNKAADEMRARVEKLTGQQPVWMGTFHRFCASLLRRYASMIGLAENYSIYDTDDSRRLMKAVLEQEDLPLDRRMLGRVMAGISWAKNEMLTPEQYTPNGPNELGHHVARLYPVYQRKLLEANAVDFDDLLMHVAVLLRENPELSRSLDERYQFIMVDEYQDTNIAQYSIVRLLSTERRNLAVTGDPDQSIYGWRGASISNILNFERDYPDVKVVRLEQNYRSTQRILRAADCLISHNRQRKAKELFTENHEGKSVRLTTYATGRMEAETIAARLANLVASGQRSAGDFAIFYRTNALSRQLERSLKNVQLPYQIVRGLEFYQRMEVKDILAYLHVLNNPQHNVAVLRTINTPPRGIGKKTIQALVKYAERKRLTLLQSARECGLNEAVSKRAAVAVARYVALMDQLGLVNQESVRDVVTAVIEQTGYRLRLEKSAREEDRQRIDNIEELVTDACEFDEARLEDGGLEAFLEETSLVSDVDELENGADRVKLMTLHAAKGLEFPVVHIIAVEEGILPHQRSREDARQLEEERRLLFVGMTRAMEELYLSFATERSFRGSSGFAAGSSFTMELPREEMEIDGEERPEANEWDDYIDDPDWDEFDEPPSADGLSSIDEAVDVVPSGDPREDRPASKSPRRLNNDRSHLVTASSLTGQSIDDLPECDPDDFRKDMLVIHPTYGLGKIAAIFGEGSRRTARVDFIKQPVVKTFRLVHSPLRPISK